MAHGLVSGAARESGPAAADVRVSGRLKEKYGRGRERGTEREGGGESV